MGLGSHTKKVNSNFHTHHLFKEPYQGFTPLQYHQSATSQDFSRAPDQPAWDQRISIDGLAMPIDVKDGNRALSASVVLGFHSEAVQRASASVSGTSAPTAGQLCQKSLGVAVAVSPTPTGEQGQSLTSVAA